MVFKAERSWPIPTKDINSWIFDSPRYDEDKPILVDAARPIRSISLAQARTHIRKLIAGLHAAGLRRGDGVSIHSFNDIYYSTLVLAIIGAGGAFAGTNPAYTPYELTHAIKVSSTKFIITEPEMLEQVRAAAKQTGLAEKNIWIFDVHGQTVPQGFRSWTDLMTHGERDWIRFDDLETARSTTAMRLFSSGTTGLFKCAMNTHYNLIAQHEAISEANPRPYEIKRIVCVPTFHAAVAPSTHTGALKGGHVSYIMRRFELEPFLAAFEKYACTEMTVVPPIAIAIIMSPLSKKYSLKSARSGFVGAAPLDKGTQARFQSLLGDGACFTQVWGMTEVNCVGTMFPYPETDDTGSIGRLIPNMEAKLIDDNGNDITGYDVEGEICCRGPTVIPGYHNNPEANKASFDKDGFFRTGDIGYCDSKTKLFYIVDRKKELIKVRGFQVAPPEIEGVLLGHPQIVDAAVIGVKFERDESELPRAYVVRRPGPEGAKLTEEDVKKYTAERLAKYKYLEGGVKLVDAIPKNASGKILKRVLREQAQKEVGAVAKL